MNTLMIILCAKFRAIKFNTICAACSMLTFCISNAHGASFTKNLSQRNGFAVHTAEEFPVLRIMTYNIRYAGAADTGVIKWDHRKKFITSIIRYHHPDIIGLQEVTARQINYFDSTLKDFSYAGVGRDDGKEGGEFSPVFFNKKRYEKMADSTFWLSPTPQQPGKGWDAALPRICTWVKLKDRESKMIFFVFNTHFDHIGKVAREESARLLLRQIYRIAGKSPVILTGDFNSEEKDTPIRILTGLSELSVYAFSDAMYISRLPHHGSIPTYCGFDIREGIAGGRIDYIFVSAGISVRNHATLTDFEGSHFPSDHFPVISELQLQQ